MGMLTNLFPKGGAAYNTMKTVGDSFMGHTAKSILDHSGANAWHNAENPVNSSAFKTMKHGLFDVGGMLDPMRKKTTH